MCYIQNTPLASASFFEDFLANALATLVGVFLALLIDRIINYKVKKNRQRDLFRLISQALEHNIELIKQIQDDFQNQGKKWIPTYNMDVSLLESTASLKYEIIDDMDLNRLLDNIRYELGHLNRKVDLLMEIRNDEQIKRENLVGSILVHSPKIHDILNDAIKHIAAK